MNDVEKLDWYARLIKLSTRNIIQYDDNLADASLSYPKEWIFYYGKSKNLNFSDIRKRLEKDLAIVEANLERCKQYEAAGKEHKEALHELITDLERVFFPRLLGFIEQFKVKSIATRDFVLKHMENKNHKKFLAKTDSLFTNLTHIKAELIDLVKNVPSTKKEQDERWMALKLVFWHSYRQQEVLMDEYDTVYHKLQRALRKTSSQKGRQEMLVNPELSLIQELNALPLSSISPTQQGSYTPPNNSLLDARRSSFGSAASSNSTEMTSLSSTPEKGELASTNSPASSRSSSTESPNSIEGSPKRFSFFSRWLKQDNAPNAETHTQTLITPPGN